MTTLLSQTQIVSAAQEKSKMLFDHEPLSASGQLFSHGSAIHDDCSQSSSQLSSASQHQLRPCIYVAFRCSQCGSVRQAIADLPKQAVIACPECNQECAFVLLGSGLTSRNLPFHQVHIVTPTQWESPDDGEPDSS